MLFLVLCSEILQGQPTFSSKVPCHILSKVLLFTGILWVCAATESQHHLAVAFSYRVHLAIPPHTMPAVYPKATRKYVSLCLQKAQKSLAKGNFTLCFLPPLSKVCCVCLSQCVCLQKQCTTELQPEKYQYLLHTIRKKESSLNRNMCFLN